MTAPNLTLRLELDLPHGEDCDCARCTALAMACLCCGEARDECPCRIRAVDDAGHDYDGGREVCVEHRRAVD